MKKRISNIVIVCLLILVAAIPASAGMEGPGISGVQIQNLNPSADAKVTVELWNQTGGAPIPLSATGGDVVKASAARTYYLPSYNGVPSGSYAMVVSADQPIAGIARTEWADTGGAALYTTVDPGTDVVVPLVTANFAGQTSHISIQNTDTANDATDVSITLYGRGLAAAVKTLPPQTIPKGTSDTFIMTDAVWGSLPNTGIDLGVSSGFVGSMRIQSSKDLVVQSFIDLAGSPAVTAFTGVPANSADTTLFCPLIRANYYGDTGINIVNPNASDVAAKITFIADAASPKQGTFSQDITIAKNSMAVAFQGLGGNSRAAGLPGGDQDNPAPTNNGFFGVAKVESNSDDPILAVVNDARFNSNWTVAEQSTYNCVSASAAGAKFALPLVRRWHLNTVRLTTGVSIQNVTDADVTVKISMFNWDGTPQAITHQNLTIPKNGSGNFYQGALQGLPTVPSNLGGSGWFGSAVVEVVGPGQIVVMVNDATGPGASVVYDSANYNALLMAP